MPHPRSSPSSQPRGLDPHIGRMMALVVWIVAGLTFAGLTRGEMSETAHLMIVGLACFTPAALITLGLMIATATRTLSVETRMLAASIEALHESVAQTPHAASPPLRQAPETPDSAPVASSGLLFLSQRHRVSQDPTDAAQSSLHFAPQPTSPDAMPPAQDLIRALHFPRDEHDTAGFETTRRALANPRLAPLIEAAQDVLSQLSQDGIYMDDLQPDHARPEIWRAFAEGARGAAISALGGVHDRSCLALTLARMRADPDFRAAAHQFLREFDRVFAQFAQTADDSQITALAQTRSARAFMLLGRVTGVFSR
ncbi:MAG: hypothetical protein EA339_11485 [Rhodobacteraceae bacterium]|nr:MAG: hypothetical protein EA339_11485 [Paracoccaceae bacterium]